MGPFGSPFGGGSGSASLSDWAIKSGAYTAVAGDRLLVDTSGAAVTITLPATPSVGDEVSLKDHAKTFDTNNLTIARNGSEIENLSEDMIVDALGAVVNLVYTADRGWVA